MSSVNDFSSMKPIMKESYADKERNRKRSNFARLRKKILGDKNERIWKKDKDKD